MVEIFTQAPLELRILISGILGGWAWFMLREYRAEKKRELHQTMCWLTWRCYRNK